MRIRQKEERRECRKKKKKPQKQPPQQQKYHHPPQTTPHPPNPPPKLQPLEPTHRRKPNTIRRFDGDVLSPVSIIHLSLSKSICQFALSWNQICKRPDKRIPLLIFSIYRRLIARSLSLLELHPELPWQTYGQEGLLSWQVDWWLTCCRFGLWLRLPSAPNSPYRPRSERLTLHPLMNRNCTAQTIPRTENFVAGSDLGACNYLSRHNGWRDFHT